MEQQQPDILFIERTLQLLNDGGTLGIVLPETFFHAPRARYVREFIKRHNIFFILDLPHNTFRPHNNAKCIVVFLQKNVPQQEFIKMAVAEEMGHDHNGKPLYRWDPESHKVDQTKLWDDIPLIEEELDSGTEGKYTFRVPAATCDQNDVYVPRYYWQTREKEVEAEAERLGFQMVPLSELIASGAIIHFDGHGSPAAENKGNGEVPYVRVKDIVNWEVYQDPTSRIPESVYDSMTQKLVTKVVDGVAITTTHCPKELRARDVLLVRRGSYRIGTVAMVSPFDTKVLLTREITVLRVVPDNRYCITPYYLLYALSHYLTQAQVRNLVLIETTLPNIGERWKQLLIPLPKSPEAITEISERIRCVIDNKWKAVEEIIRIREELGGLTT